MQLIAREAKFAHPKQTAAGEPRAHVGLQALETLWFNTGTLCNLTCSNCYIESSPSNDALVYLTRDEVAAYLEEIRTLRLPVQEIGITGGEPFMNPDILHIVADSLAAGHRVLLLTNAMRPMMKCAAGLLAIKERFGNQLTVRVSIDHYDQALHEEERGKRSWAPMIAGLRWLADNGFQMDVAGRTRWGDEEAELRAGFASLFAAHNIPVDASNPAHLVLFPEMDPNAEVPEITTACWGILNVNPNDLMCASARMVVKPKGAPHPRVMACTLLAYDHRFAFGPSLAESLGEVSLNHPALRQVLRTGRRQLFSLTNDLRLASLGRLLYVGGDKPPA